MSQQNPKALLDLGLREHQAGNLAEAGALYRQLLAGDPGNCDALHLLGVLAYQAGRHEEALACISQAVAVRPAGPALANLGLVLMALGRVPDAIAAYRRAIAVLPSLAEAHNNLGTALRMTGETAEAISAYRQAVSLRPDFAEAHNNLGLAFFDQGELAAAVDSYHQAIALLPHYAEARNNLGTAIFRQGDADKAIACWREALSLKQNFPEAYNNLGNALKQLGRHEEAVAAFRQALAQQPAFAMALNNLGVVHHERGEFAQAIEFLQRAVAANPQYAEAHYNLAIAFHAAKEPEQAIESCRRALALRAAWPEARNNLGIWLLETGSPRESLAALDAALAARPHYAPAHVNRGNALQQLGRVDEAIESYRRAASLKPCCAQTQNNLGAAYQRAGRMESAMDAFRAATALQPDFSEAYNNLGNVLKDQGDLDGAIACFERAVELDPANSAADSNRVYTLYFHPAFDAAAILREHERWSLRHTRAAAPLGHRPERTSNRRLRIGYISPDFREHCQAMFTTPLLSNHDHSGFEITCYSDTTAPDAVTQRLHDCTDRWRTTAGMSDARLAAMIRADRTDILVDLTAHMAHNRLAVFAEKPAPVQVTWLAYPGTTGLKAIDYRLSDPYLDPPGSERFYCEQTLRLPDSFWCYDPLTAGPWVNPLPAMQAGHVTFGCLNNFCKINDATLRLWAWVMAEFPSSRLLLLAPRGAARQRVIDVMAECGIDRGRLDFSGRLPRGEYLELYHQIDIALDTFPYNGHTTTLDALWMGVPVVTRVGQTAVGRGGLSQLSNLQLEQFAAHDDEEFVRIAVRLGGSLERMQHLRQTLRQRLMQSPLADGPRFAANIEAAFQHMWKCYRRQARQETSTTHSGQLVEVACIP